MSLDSQEHPLGSRRFTQRMRRLHAEDLFCNFLSASFAGNNPDNPIERSPTLLVSESHGSALNPFVPIDVLGSQYESHVFLKIKPSILP